MLITLRRDGRAQSSQVVFSWRDGTARISVTADRAKTRNARRDPRVVLHVLGDDFGTYLALDAVVTLSEPVTGALRAGVACALGRDR